MILNVWITTLALFAAPLGWKSEPQEVTLEEDQAYKELIAKQELYEFVNKACVDGVSGLPTPTECEGCREASIDALCSQHKLVEEDAFATLLPKLDQSPPEAQVTIVFQLGGLARAHHNKTSPRIDQFLADRVVMSEPWAIRSAAAFCLAEVGSPDTKVRGFRIFLADSQLEHNRYLEDLAQARKKWEAEFEQFFNDINVTWDSENLRELLVNANAAEALGSSRAFCVQEWDCALRLGVACLAGLRTDAAAAALVETLQRENVTEPYPWLVDKVLEQGSAYCVQAVLDILAPLEARMLELEKSIKRYSKPKLRNPPRTWKGSKESWKNTERQRIATERSRLIEERVKLLEACTAYQTSLRALASQYTVTLYPKDFEPRSSMRWKAWMAKVKPELPANVVPTGAK